MKNTLKRMLCLLLALTMCAGLALGAAADEGKVTEPDPAPEPEEIQIIQKDDQDAVYIGDTLQLKASIYPNTYKGSVTWSIDDDSKTIASVDSNGLVKGLAEGTAEITVTVDDHENISDTFSVTVKEDAITSFYVEGDGLVKAANDKYTLKILGTGSFTLTGVTEHESGKKPTGADWRAPTDLSVITGDGNGSFTVVGTGKADITATCPKDSSKTATITVTVTAPSTSLKITGDGVSNSKVTMAVGDTLKLTATRQPENSFDTSAIEWGSSKTGVATVGKDGTVTAVANGTAVITASCNGGETKASVTVTVTTPSSDVKDSTTKGTTIKGLADIEYDLRAAFKAIYKTDPDKGGSSSITFTPPAATYGTLYKNSATSTSGNKVTKSDSFTLSAVRGMYFVPNSIGSYVLPYKLTGANKAVMEGTITITVTSKSADVTIKLSDGSGAYTFSSSSNENRTAATKLISDAITEASGSKSYSSISFGSPTPASKKVGTLYANSSEKSLASYDDYTASTSGTHPVSKLYFVPAQEGEYTIGYTAYDSTGKELCSGDLTIEVGVTDSATVTVTLDDDDAYTFSEKTSKDKKSAATAINDAVKDYSYIIFSSSVSSGSSVGTLYADSDKSSLGSGRKYSRSTSASYSVSDLYFVPEKAGAYVRSFIAYDSNNDELLEGKLKIVVPSESSSDMDIYFNTTTGSSISLGEDVFESWFRQEKGSGYKLAYVTFDDVSRSYGTFKHGSSSFTPGNDVRYYDGDYTGSTGSSAKYLDSVKYTAPGSVGYVSVDFTCYGGTSSSASGTKVSGTFCIYVTKSSVNAISYDAKYGSSVTLRESDFSTVHKNAMSLGSATSTKYYIELLEAPSKGTLYYDYTSSSRPGTKLTGSNFDDYKFYVNANSSYDSVEDLTYWPANSATGSVSVRYLARSTDGEAMYVGSINFNYGKDQAASISCGADGYTFKASDFYSGSDSDPVAYVTFRQPSSGELMLNYANGRGIPLDSSVRLYTLSYTNGAYAVSSVSYIPKAGFSGIATIDYTAVTETGKSQSGTVAIAVSSKKSSSRFKDVTSTGSGAWASDSIDFAYKWGLVNGTGADTFSPDNTMTRAMLVTILYRAAGSPKVSGACRFSDVPAGTYYYDAVIWAADNGIVTGTSQTTFSPDRDVNREQVAAFLQRYAKYNGEDVSVTGTLSGYVDKSSVSSYAIEPVSWAVQRGYITSASSTEKLLSPGGSATRAQVAVMIHRFLTY